MTGEFTGERVVPGLVEPDLWNEHFVRYAFVRRAAAGKRVLDMGCGTGYGSAELARVAAFVTGVDVAEEALGYASATFVAENLRFEQASCTQLPFADGSFDLVVCFEVIEHLADWPALLSEARRVLADSGIFVVSTPNKSFYGETRALTGPNPYHAHEFEYEEYTRALRALFPHVAMYLQNHVSGVAVHADCGIASAEVEVAQSQADPETANFFIGVCSGTPLPIWPAFVYIPEASNILREKSIHIARLQEQLQEQKSDHLALLRAHEEQEAALLGSNRWASETAAELEAARAVIAAEQQAAREMAAGYEAEIAELQAELQRRVQWNVETETRLNSELAKCVDLLNKAEATLAERTQWALELDSRRQHLEAAVAAVRSSRWLRVGRAVGLGPELEGR